jgi:hypothetical protein
VGLLLFSWLFDPGRGPAPHVLVGIFVELCKAIYAELDLLPGTLRAPRAANACLVNAFTRVNRIFLSANYALAGVPGCPLWEVVRRHQRRVYAQNLCKILVRAVTGTKHASTLAGNALEMVRHDVHYLI